jgi:hypothetical protein
VQRLFIGLLCFPVLYGLCGCASFKDTSSRSGQESLPQQSETKAPAVIPPTSQTCTLDPAACVPPTAPLAAAPDKAAPIVQVPEATFDLGIMREDKTFVHKFLIKNVGASELTIKKISPG